MDECLEMMKALLGKIPCCRQSFTINGTRYRVVKLLAEGGFSFVFLVKKDNASFVVKRILCQVSEQLREAEWEIKVHKMLGNDNANVIPLLGSEITPLTTGGSQVALLYNFYDRGTLLDLLANRAAKNDELPERVILDFLLQIGNGLSALHNLDPSLAHRDLKVHNLLLGNDNNLVLMDFGSAAPARVDISSRRTRLQLKDTAAQKSSMAYRAPELWEPSDDPGCVVDERTDVWSLGCVLFAMLFGQGYSPFECKFPSAYNRTGGPFGGGFGSTSASPDKYDQDLEGRATKTIPRAEPRDCTYLAVIGEIPIPEVHSRSTVLVDLLHFILEVSPSQRPRLSEVMDRVRAIKQENLEIY